ncbi:hypothetical protein ACK312_04480 [Aeromonas caviae]
MSCECSKDKDEKDSEKKRVKKVLGEPYPLQLSEYEERVRRNLLAYSVVSIAATFLGATSVEKPVLFGMIELPRFSSGLIYYGLSLLIFYELVNYGAMLWNSFSYWRIRLTGSRLNPSRSSGETFSSGNESVEDVSGEERNSTIYTWLFEQELKVSVILRSIKDSSDQLSEIQHDFKERKEVPGGVESLESCVKALESYTGKLECVILSARVHESFLRYDKWFHYMLKTQSLRWLLLDCAIPILLGLFALIILLWPVARHSVVMIINNISALTPLEVDAIISI